MKTMLAGAGLALVLLIPTSAIAKPDKTERNAARARYLRTRLREAGASPN